MSCQPSLPLSALSVGLASVACVSAVCEAGAVVGRSAGGSRSLRVLGTTTGSIHESELLSLAPFGNEADGVGLVTSGGAAASGNALGGEGGGWPSLVSAGVGAENGAPTLGGVWSAGGGT